MPRPTYDREVVMEEILDRIAAGESVRQICKSDHLPNEQAVHEWLRNDPALVERYKEARETQASRYFEEIIEIADTATDPQKARVQIDARKWVLAKMNAKKYGDKVDHTVGGATGGPVVIELIAAPHQMLPAPDADAIELEPGSWG